MEWHRTPPPPCPSAPFEIFQNFFLQIYIWLCIPPRFFPQVDTIIFEAISFFFLPPTKTIVTPRAQSWVRCSKKQYHTIPWAQSKSPCITIPINHANILEPYFQDESKNYLIERKIESTASPCQAKGTVPERGVIWIPHLPSLTSAQAKHAIYTQRYVEYVLLR